MNYINPNLYNATSFLEWVRGTANIIADSVLGGRQKPEYKLLCLIYEAVSATFYSNKPIEYEWADFPAIRRNTRYAIEGMIDLSNYACDKTYQMDTYMKVLRFNHYKSSEYIPLGKYKKYLHWGYFTIISKRDIAIELYQKDFNWATDWLEDDLNPYAHPDIFIEEYGNTMEKRVARIQWLLNLNLRILKNAFDSYCKATGVNDHIAKEIMPCNYNCNNPFGTCQQCLNCAYLNTMATINTVPIVNM